MTEPTTTLAIIKPDAVAAGNSIKIITVIESSGFEIKSSFETTLTVKQAQLFYTEHQDQPFFSDLVTFMSSGPLVLLALELPESPSEVISRWRGLIGATNPQEADKGTIRASFATSKSRNAVHGSDSVSSAERELLLMSEFKNSYS